MWGLVASNIPVLSTYLVLIRNVAQSQSTEAKRGDRREMSVAMMNDDANEQQQCPTRNNHSPLSSKDVDRKEASRSIAFRPRLLYTAIFVWNTLTVGKFTAPLLQLLSSRFSDSVIGFTFALQYGVVACLAGWGGALADAQERKSSLWGWGRLKVLTFALSLGTLAFLGHFVPEFLQGVFPNNSTVVLIWHISMRCVYAISFGIVAPCLDGLALAHLDCIGSSSADFGKERMFGALFWGLGNLSAGVCIDYYGFDSLYVLVVISTFASYVVMGIYLWGLKNDMTGAFKSHGNDGELSSNSASEYQHEDAKDSDENDEMMSNRELLFKVFKTGYGRALLFLVFTLAMGISVVDNLAFMFFDSLGASSTMDGWTVMFTVIFEIPVFYASPKLLERYGPGKLLFAAAIAYIIRVVGYTMVPAGEVYTMFIILALETLHGVTYAGSKAGGVEYIACMIPEGYEASGQGILIFVTYFSVVAGLIMAGWIQETLGARFMFRVMAAIVTVGVIVFLLAEVFYDEAHTETHSKEESEPNEKCHLMKSESCASSASAFADVETERCVPKFD
mmetsp:Transcript_44660/g.95051  ORF Transcript_44660/g.95051 Transcript_44660/m.95051 type:complete len:562 (-) Transcript_44660:580-2265(-)